MARRIAALAMVATLVASGISAQNTTGRWQGPFDWGIITAGAEIGHAALTLTGPLAGRVLLWRAESVSPSTETYVFDRADPTNLYTLSDPNPILTSNIFCAGHVFLPDGRRTLLATLPLERPPADHGPDRCPDDSSRLRRFGG